MDSNRSGPRNMRTFWVIWGGQLISMLGSGLTSFGLGVWIYDQTGQATPFALTVLFGSLPYVLLAPLAGALADRWNRRLIMIVTDTGSALLTLLIAAMLFLAPGGLQVWQDGHQIVDYPIGQTEGEIKRILDPRFVAGDQ